MTFSDRPQSLPAPITNHTDNYVHTVFSFPQTISNFSKFDVHSSSQHAERKHTGRPWRYRQREGFIIMAGCSWPIRLAELGSCCGTHMKLPALTYTCTDLHISHPEIYNSNLVARQGQTVAKTSASQCTYIRHRTTCKCPIGAYATDIHVYGTDIHPAKDAYATDIHVYGTDIHPG